MHDLFDQSITIAQNTCNHRESLSVVIDEAIARANFQRNGWVFRVSRLAA